MKPHPESVVVRVPASTSNCGAGFDTLGLALGLFNRITITRDPGETPIPETQPDARARDMVGEAAAAFTRETGKSVGFRYRIAGDVPPARGLGSSVTVIAGVMAGLDALYATSLGAQRLVGLTAAIEGHPDNAGAGILGGFCVSRSDPTTGAFLDTQRFTVPKSVAFVVVSPPVELVTKESRSALPSALPFFDAVKSINSASYLVAAFASGNFAKLAYAAGDFVHEPYRLPFIPGASDAIRSGIASGAWTGWLSGSGSSVLCVCERVRAAGVAVAMNAAFERASLKGDARILDADNDGLTIEA